MKINNLSKVLVILGIVAVIGFAATSFAGWGRGGGGNCGAAGYGMNRSGYDAPCNQRDLSDEDSAKLDNERRAFIEETSELRENLYQKELELRAELAKKDPDAKKAVEMQKEISDLEGRLDQKRVEQRIKMQKENPGFFADRGWGRGYGYGGRGMGRGFQGRGGGCWY